jgi:hypothetical protein
MAALYLNRADFFWQKYGVDLIRFTHSKNAAIHASTKRDDAVRDGPD